MNVTVNGDTHILGDGLSIGQLLDQLGIDQRKGMAVARNGKVIPKSEWDGEELEDGDTIEVVRATQGG